MSAQKNKTVLATTLAVIAVFLLSGVSLMVFPSQTQLPPQINIPSNLAFSSASGSFNQIDSSNASTPANILWVSSFRPLDCILISKDGNVNSTAIQRQSDTYTLTEDITNQTIVVEKNGIILNGANHALTGYISGNIYALENIHIENASGITIKNFNISLSSRGIYLLNSTGITIENNNFTDINTGINAYSSSNCKVTENNFANLSIAVCFSKLEGFEGPQGNLVSKNTIDGVVTGITLSYANFSTVTDNVVVNAYDSIYADVNATIARNTLIKGIDAISAASYDRIYDNLLSDFSESGILLSGVNSSIYQNTVANSSAGVAMSGSSDAFPLGGNAFWHNNFLNNTKSVALYTNASLSFNNWDNGKEGNYWSGYNGSDGNGDGVGDSQYVLAANCTDNYPLMQPYVAASSDLALGTLFFAAAVVTALIGAAVIVCVYAKFRGRS